MDDCIFCKIVRGEIPSEKLYVDSDIIAFADIDPKAPVHILIIPVKHIEKVSDLTEADAKLISGMFSVANQLAQAKGVAEKGYRLVINCGRDAGQAVGHLHLHLLGGRCLTWPPG